MPARRGGSGLACPSVLMLTQSKSESSRGKKPWRWAELWEGLGVELGKLLAWRAEPVFERAWGKGAVSSSALPLTAMWPSPIPNLSSSPSLDKPASNQSVLIIQTPSDQDILWAKSCPTLTARTNHKFPMYTLWDVQMQLKSTVLTVSPVSRRGGGFGQTTLVPVALNV